MHILLSQMAMRYQPANEEMYGIMNLLDPILRTANSGSVQATVKCFFSLTNKVSAVSTGRHSFETSFNHRLPKIDILLAQSMQDFVCDRNQFNPYY